MKVLDSVLQLTRLAVENKNNFISVHVFYYGKSNSLTVSMNGLDGQDLGFYSVMYSLDGWENTHEAVLLEFMELGICD